jgi:hypothetical protein
MCQGFLKWLCGSSCLMFLGILNCRMCFILKHIVGVSEVLGLKG